MRLERSRETKPRRNDVDEAVCRAEEEVRGAGA